MMVHWGFLILAFVGGFALGFALLYFLDIIASFFDQLGL